MTKDHFETCFFDLSKDITFIASLYGFKTIESLRNGIAVCNEEDDVLIFTVDSEDQKYSLKVEQTLPVTCTAFHLYMIFEKQDYEISPDICINYDLKLSGRNSLLKTSFNYNSLEELSAEINGVMTELFYDRKAISFAVSKEINIINKLYLN